MRLISTQGLLWLSSRSPSRIGPDSLITLGASSHGWPLPPWSQRHGPYLFRRRLVSANTDPYVGLVAWTQGKRQLQSRTAQGREVLGRDNRQYRTLESIGTGEPTSK